MARVLARVRLSYGTEESTSVERQMEIVENWAGANQHTVVGWAIDVDVSRSVDPFEAPDLKPWLTIPEKIEAWDIIVCWKLDRLATGSIYLNKLMAWGQANDKAIVSVTENFDLNSWVGRMIANVIAGVAEGEWEAIRERTLSSRDKLRRLGRWAGGAPVYGLRAVPRDGEAGYVVERDPDAFDTLRWLVERTLAGDSLNSLAKTLNERGVLTPQDLHRWQKGRPTRGAKWRTSTIRSILTSPTLLGHMPNEGKAVRGPDGMPVKAGDHAVSPAEWRQLQARLVEGVKPRQRTDTTSLLLDVGFCKRCNSKLHRQAALKKGRNYSYYLCASENGERSNPCGSKRIRADMLDELVTEHLMDAIGDVERTEKVLVPGEDHTAELEEARLGLEELMKMAGQAKSQSARELFAKQVEALDARIAQLEGLPSRPDEWVDRGTGKTYRELWEEASVQDRRRLMIDSGIKVYAQEDPFSFDLYVPDDILARISS